MLQAWILGGKREDLYISLYLNFTNSLESKLLRQSEMEKLLYVAEIDGVLVNDMELLSCYIPGLLALGVLHA